MIKQLSRLQQAIKQSGSLALAEWVRRAAKLLEEDVYNQRCLPTNIKERKELLKQLKEELPE